VREQSIEQVDELGEPADALARAPRDTGRALTGRRVPTPSAISRRPSERWSTVTAALAAVTGWRKYRLVTSVPRRIRSVLTAITASVLGPSSIIERGWSGSTTVSTFQRTSNPSSSARRHRSSSSDTGRFWYW
jgi:hypothetical protein